MKVIALTEEDVLMVAGPGDDGSELDPVPYHLGGFILGLAVLSDPAHANVHDYLAALAQIEYVRPTAGDDA